MGKIVYWVSTLLICALYLLGTGMYIFNSEMANGAYVALGYPVYIINVLIFAKIGFVLAVLVRRPVWLSDLAYAGGFFHLLLAISAHLNVNDGGHFPAIVGLVLLLVSFFTQNAARAQKSPYAGERFGSA